MSKGIIRRVTDSVTGLFSASWLSGWMGGEDEEESSDQQAGSSQTSTEAPAGESFIFAQPVTARRPFRPIYPEEGETEANSQQSLGINEGASTSSGVRMSVPTAASVGISSTTSRSLQLIGDTPSPTLSGRRLPIISSTPAPMFSARTKSQLEPRSLPLLTTSTPTGDDGSEMSESSVDTGVDASVIPRPDERDYQREILQLDDESLQTLRDSLAKSVPAAPVAQPAGALPSLEETRKRPRDLEPDHTSVRAEGSVSSKSLFSETSDIVLGQPQPSGMTSKRPRFNASIYGTPMLGDKSVLSDSTFKSSPFYPGKTMYGGASAYRSRRLQSRTPHQTSRAQVRAKVATESTDDGGLSQAARRILESLEQMSTPISDAKRIPTPTPGQRGSFLDAAPSYTAAFHRHRPVLRPSAPPTSRLLTPTKLTVQENLTTSLLATSSASTSLSSGSPSHKKSTTSEEAPQPTTKVTVTEQGETKKPTKLASENFSASPFSKAAAEATAIFKSSQPTVSSVTQADQPTDVFKFGLPSNSSASENTFEFASRPSTTMSTFTSDSPQSTKKFGGKIKSKIADSGRTSNKREVDEIIEEPQLPAVSLNMSSLPTINLSIPSPVQSLPTKLSSSPEGFKFSTPEIVDTHSTSETLTSAPKFTFRSPALIGEGNLTGDDLGTTVASTPPPMFNSSSQRSAPKLKANSKKAVAPTAEKLKRGSVLDFLKGNDQDKVTTTSSPVSNSLGEKLEKIETLSKVTNTGFRKSVSEQSVNNVAKETEVSQGFQGFGSAFKKSSEEWECNACMIRNKNSADKCVACETQRPGQNFSIRSKEATSCAANVDKTSLPILDSEMGWGDAFKRSASEWECNTCMLRNKDSTEKCVACETRKPGSETVCAVSAEVNKIVDIKEGKVNSGFGSAFAKGKDEWECDTCLVRNKSEDTNCISCETPKPGAASVSPITGNFKFGVNDSSSTDPTFKFGLSNYQTTVKSSSGFNFGDSAKSTEVSDSKGNSGFKFGVPEKPNILTGFSFNSNSESVQSKEKSQCGSGGFNFGIQSLDSKDKEITDKAPSLFPISISSESSSETGPAPNLVFKFSSGSKTPVAFSFGSGTEVKTAVKEGVGKSIPNEINPTIELKSGNSHDTVNKERDIKSNDMFSFGSKADNVDGGITKPSFTFNNVITSGKDNDTKNTTTSSFGAPKVTESVSNPSSTLAFGANSGGNAFPPGETFKFGDNTGSKATIMSSFSFISSSVKGDSKPATTFEFSTKRDSSDTSEPTKKITFASNTTGGINNGVSASPLFTFGSKESKLNAGSGFGAVPSSTPAFGAPAPASSATSNFQFGKSNPPPPAATAPAPASAFGNPASTFGSASSAFGSNNNNNSSTPSFAFGQPAEKKSAGFDFGQAANNTGSSGFNFAGPGTQTTPSIFQFGQSQANSTPSSGIFAFGSNNSDVSAPASSFGNSDGNPFNTPATPSGRVMKKAVRRARKQ
ncbi:nuclear pore complex protein Nup153-like isoform X2 [Homarus americanus]|uniref:nuclear pore complex protein Nup153-like isoform X2 n=1 Tax=Homarus americanus TaxID=6706 RepID=UPI001C462A76|nr:nuclear pore complex protein Nup153-like isoform X2 [Homarus americanus]